MSLVNIVLSVRDSLDLTLSTGAGLAFRLTILGIAVWCFSQIQWRKVFS